ncbi:MAG TPA: DUF3891 family protein [Tepidisphaeraceae bacterium]|jgi:hypothetical protein|nr:DUF3891 family protein [Tepidisphaeraceae bacterium]
MIRRDETDGYLLITQNDHAKLSGQLAACVGNERFGALIDNAAAVRGITLHDCGWPVHDEAPTINPKGQPTDVFESPHDVALRVWTESAARATAEGPYPGLLVSLHVLHLSLLADARKQDVHERFAVNKFQHAEVERQETLRQSLGLRIDRPLMHGLADPHADPLEDALRYHFRWLQTLDQISLALCCTAPPISRTTELHPHAGDDAVKLSLECTGERALRIDPWPFDRPSIDLQITGRLVPRVHYDDAAQLRTAYATAAERSLHMRLHGG